MTQITVTGGRLDSRLLKVKKKAEQICNSGEAQCSSHKGDVGGGVSKYFNLKAKTYVAEIAMK